MSKIQLRGICQCCGREQAVVKGRMSKHGYTVEQGWFQGVCSGQHFAPMNVERAQTDKIVAQVRKEVAEIRVTVQGLKDGKIVPTKVYMGRDRMTKQEIFKDWADASEYEQKKAVDQAIWNNEGRARQGDQFADFMEKKVNEVFGTALKEVKMDEAKPQIEVGSKVKLNGSVVVVEKIGYAVASGVGPGINGKSVEHIWFSNERGTFKYPKRYAKLVTE